MGFRQHLLLSFLITVCSVSAKNLSRVKSTTDDCDRRQCKGPILYYDELNCKPIYKKPDDCCPIQYDCSNLVNQSPNKCYAAGKEYEIGEQLNTSRSCQNCVCQQDSDSRASFSCEHMFCDHPLTNEVFNDCYIRQSYENPCCGEKVCVESLSDTISCEVDGRTYKEGETFVPQNNLDLICYCLKGYKGRNVEPFCKRRKCGFELEHNNPIRDGVAPVYVQESYRAIYCPPEFLRGDKEYVVNRINKSTNDDELARGKQSSCTFGNRTILVGDEFYAKLKVFRKNYATSCYKCLCEVPPLLACSKVWFDCDLLPGEWRDLD